MYYINILHITCYIYYIYHRLYILIYIYMYIYIYIIYISINTYMSLNSSRHPNYNNEKSEKKATDSIG